MVEILEYTTKAPYEMIGRMMGVCYGTPIDNYEKNVKRGMQGIEAGHGRVVEFPDIYMILDGYSAKVIRELYTHIGGSPTRLQASTRYIDYKNFEYVTPPSIEKNKNAKAMWDRHMRRTAELIDALEDAGIPKEDASNLLPLAYSTKMVYKINARTLMEMSHQRMCTRAYWEYRNGIMKDIISALSDYSPQWRDYCENYLKPKCEVLGYCQEHFSCGKNPKNKTFATL